MTMLFLLLYELLLQLKINKGSQLVLKFSSVCETDVTIVCLAGAFTLKDTI